METDARSPEKKIKDEIREAYAKTYPNCIFSLTNHIERLKAELKALETALAAKDSEILNARREVTEAYVLSLQHILDGVIVLDTPKLVIRIEKTIRGLMEADLSLSPPTGKVLIDIERVVTFIAANTPTRCCGCVSRLIDGVRELKDTQ